MRTHISIRLECAICGTQLEAANDKTKSVCDSARHMETRMAIVPCTACMREAKAPALAIKNALASLEQTHE